MKLITTNTKDEAAQQALEIMQEEMQTGRLDVLGLATGSTMLPVYNALVNCEMSFENVTAFNLDEYVGLDIENENSYAYYMNEQLFNKKKFKQAFIPNGAAEDLEEECTAYEELLNRFPLDIQFLGIGENGHIAFNEPGTSLASNTHVVNLTASTLGANSRFFDNQEQIPTTALTMGISSILSARKIILLAFGEHKRFALEKLFAGNITTEYPVTALNNHDDVTVITDIAI